MEIYIAICLDRHVDEDVRVFSTPSKAIEYAKSFMSNEEGIEDELTEGMIRNGWIYSATYGTEGDSVRVEKGQLDDAS